MVTKSPLHDCRTELSSADLKVTPARVAILKLLESSNTPLDVATIISALTIQEIKTDPATVFRVMNVLKEAGLIRQLQLNEGKFRYEVLGEDHHHLICEKCGAIEDISDCNISLLEQEIFDKREFKVKRHSLEFFGVCKRCQEEK